MSRIQKLEEFTVRISLYFIAVYCLFILLGVFSKPVYETLLIRPIETFDRLRAQTEFEKQPYWEWYFYEPYKDEKGVVTYHPDLASGDYTFFSNASEQKAFLIDMKGEVVHTWQGDLEKLWPSPPVSKLPPRQKRHWCRVFLQPNGDIFVQYCLATGTRHEIGLIKLDKESNVIWRYEGATHHDIALTPEGKIYVLASAVHEGPHPALPKVKPPFVEEFIIILDENGRELERLSLLEMLANSPVNSLLKELHEIPSDPFMKKGDIFHPNAITIIPEDVAGKAPMLKAGHVMVSFRNLDLLAIFDLENNTASWAAYGPWKGMHSPKFFPDGSLVLFDNQGDLMGENGSSRILRVDLNDLSIMWQYTGTKDNRLYSQYNSSVDLLSGNHILITETQAGRILEISPENEIVWEYYVPQRISIGGKERIPSIFSGRRFSREDLPFLNSF